MAFRYSRSAMTGAAIFTLAGVTVLPLAQANAAPVSPQDEARSGATQGQPNSAAQNGQDQGQQQGANASGQSQDGATQDPSQAASGGKQQQGQPSASQDKQGSNVGGQSQQQGANANAQGQQQAQPSASQDKQGSNVGGQSQQQSANGQGQQAPQSRGASSASQNGQGQQQGASASQSSSNSNSASQNNQSRHSQPSAPANQNSGFIAITSVDGFIDPQNTDNVLSVETTGIDNTHRVQYEPRVQELDEFGNIVNDDVSNGGGSSLGSDGSFGMYVSVDGTKINPNHQYRVYIDVFDQDTLTTSYAYYPIVVWNRTYIPVVPLSAAQ